MADPKNDAPAIAELSNLKAKIEQESAEIVEEREKLIEKLRLVRQEKESQLAKNAEIYQKIFEERPECLAAKRQVDILANHILSKKDTFDSSVNDVLNQLTMSSFAESIDKLRSSIESAINFYSEDSLQMELMKRNNANRELRVELTRISNEIEQKRKELEAEMEEKRRIKQAELERQKQEEERKLLIAEEATRKVIRQSPALTPELSTTSFRSVTFACRSPEPPCKQNFTRESTLSPEIDGSKTGDGNSKSKFNISLLPSFSQLTRGW